MYHGNIEFSGLSNCDELSKNRASKAHSNVELGKAEMTEALSVNLIAMLS